jgi:hypothetical protein
MVLLAFGLAFGAASAFAATTPPHHHKHRPVLAYYTRQPPLNVNKRSWLDPGPVAPVGSAQNYILEGAYFAQTPDMVNFPSRFREDVLPRPLYVPGTMNPVVTFDTPRDPFN